MKAKNESEIYIYIKLLIEKIRTFKCSICLLLFKEIYQHFNFNFNYRNLYYSYIRIFISRIFYLLE